LLASTTKVIQPATIRFNITKTVASSSTARTTTTGSRGSTARRASACSIRTDGTPTRRCTGRLLGVGSPSQPQRSPAASGRPGSAARAIRWLPLGFRAWLRPGGGTGTSCHVPVQALQVRRGMPIKDLVDRHRHGHDRLVLGRPLTKEGPGSFLVPPTVVHTAAEQDRDAARTRNPGYAATTRRAVVPARRPSSPAACSHPMRAHPTATERCDYDHPDVPAEIRCRPVECHVTGRPDGRDRESRPVGESPRWP
jgi:hypothetical protein